MDEVVLKTLSHHYTILDDDRGMRHAVVIEEGPGEEPREVLVLHCAADGSVWANVPSLNDNEVIRVPLSTLLSELHWAAERLSGLKPLE